MERDNLIAAYFDLGYPYRLIICFLYYNHGINLSLRQLKRILRRLNLQRRLPLSRSRLHAAILLIQNELRGSGAMLGYRSLQHRLRSRYGLTISRDIVMNLLSAMSPMDSASRRRHRLVRRTYRIKGPNYVWHVDGMDKIKPYGFGIHGCIDGYSRRVLWLHVGYSNNNPSIIAYYYLKCVFQLKGTPRLLRSDCGTENSHLAFIQPYLRRNDTDCFSGMESFRYGKSTTNQRIEAWWSQLNRSCTHWWRRFFKAMEENGLYDNTSYVHVDCLRFSFMHLIQKDLDRTRLEWNTHRIRPVRNSGCPSGYPDELYFMPEILGTQDYKCGLDEGDLSTVCEYAEVPDPPSLEFLLAAQQIMNVNGIDEMPDNAEEALDLYTTLVSSIEQVNSTL